LGAALHKGRHVGAHHHLFHGLLFITNVFINISITIYNNFPSPPTIISWQHDV
jgi:hypothetical protein